LSLKLFSFLGLCLIKVNLPDSLSNLLSFLLSVLIYKILWESS